MYEPSQEPLGGAIDEEEEEEDHERANGEDEPRDGGDGSGGERTIETRGPVAAVQRADGYGAPEERGHACSPEFTRRSLEELRRREEASASGREKLGRGDEVGRVAASVPP
jgi:hypothetical protein